MKKVPFIPQHDESDCGAACLASVLLYYGKYVPIRSVREHCGTDREGTSGYGIVKGAEHFGLYCKCAFSKEKDLSDISLPAIFLLHKKSDHYVIVCKISDNFVFVSDPDMGYRKIPAAEFKEEWSGIFFILYPKAEFKKGGGKTRLVSYFFELVKPHKKIMVNTIIASLMLSIFGIVTSFYFRFLIDEVLYSEAKSTLTICSLSFMLIIIFRAVISFCRSQIILYLGRKLDISLSGGFFAHLLRLPLSFFSARKTGEILSRINDAATVRDAVSSTTLSLIIDSFMILIGGAVLVKTGGVLLPLAIVPIILSSAVVYFFSKSFQRQIKYKAVLEAERNGFMYESINGIATIKALSTEREAFERVEEKILETTYASLRLGKTGNRQKAIMDFISGAGTLALYWLGSFLIFEGRITLGQLISFVTLSGFFLNPLQRLLTMQLYLQEVGVSADRLFDIMDMDEELEQKDDTDIFPDLSGNIKFENVSFTYGTRGKSLDGINLEIEGGSTVAFVGMSGSGKSTLLKLLMKFYQPSDGKITVGGEDIECFPTKKYRERIGYVPQESFLFSGTVIENIAWGTPVYNFKQIEQCAEDSMSAEFIRKFPDKYNTYIGEAGSNLSGGERQRLSLARVMMRNPQILLLDEATASLDGISERAITNAIFNRTKGVTTIIVAHRLSAIKNCDKIFVFDKGHLVEAGNHNLLMSLENVYYNLWSAQNGRHLESA